LRKRLLKPDSVQSTMSETQTEFEFVEAPTAAAQDCADRSGPYVNPID
jgi:hypothetical protein